jgi:antitoxin PrlF
MDSHYPSSMPPILEAEATVTTQNQITIPAPIRKVLDLGAGGDRIVFRVLEKGEVLVFRVHPEAAQEEDPALGPFLELLAKGMAKHPKRIKPFPAKLLARARTAVKGVHVDLDGPLTGRD